MLKEERKNHFSCNVYILFFILSCVADAVTHIMGSDVGDKREKKLNGVCYKQYVLCGYVKSSMEERFNVNILVKTA